MRRLLLPLLLILIGCIPRTGEVTQVRLASVVTERGGQAAHLGHGLFLTAAHVVDPGPGRLIPSATQVWVDGRWLPGSVVLDPVEDLAVVCVPGHDGPAVQLAASPPEPGQVLSVWRAVGARVVEHTGTWKACGTHYVVDVPAAPGWSGSPVLGPDAEVVGVLTHYGLEDARGVVLPIEHAASLLDRSRVKHGPCGAAVDGVQLAPIPACLD